MKYIKLFNENVNEIKNYFNNILDYQNIFYETSIATDRAQKFMSKYKNENSINRMINISLTYPSVNSFENEDLEESIGYLKDDGFKISENRIYFFFLDIEHIPMRSFTDKIPSKHDIHSLYKEASDKNGETSYPEDCENGNLRIKLTIYK